MKNIRQLQYKVIILLTLMLIILATPILTFADTVTDNIEPRMISIEETPLDEELIIEPRTIKEDIQNKDEIEPRIRTSETKQKELIIQTLKTNKKIVLRIMMCINLALFATLLFFVTNGLGVMSGNPQHRRHSIKKIKIVFLIWIISIISTILTAVFL